MRSIVAASRSMVHGEDIADALAEHPSVREAAVVGIPDDRLGAVPAAAVILKEGASVTEDELRAFLRARLLPYQVPAAFRIVDDLPRTPSMKPMIPAVQALFANASLQA
jgi:long-chain acyl-CoA synthetase